MADISIVDVRQKYPQYDHLSDQDLGDRLYNRFYSDKMPKDQFMSKVGLNQSPEPPQEMNTLSSIANSPGVNAILGAGDALQHNIANVMGLLPGVSNVPQAHNGSGAAYNVGDFLGNTAAFLGGGEALGGARLASEGLPLVGRIAAMLGKTPGMISRTAGAAGYGALNSPEDRLGGAEHGAELGVLGESIPYAGNLIKAGIDQFKPQNLVNGIIKHISGGQSLEDVAKSLAVKVKNLYKSKQDEAKTIYDAVFKSPAVRDGSIYPPVNPSGILAESTVPKFEFKGAPSDIAESHSVFNKDPSLQNAHNLQSDLGREIRDLKSTYANRGFTGEERELMKSYTGARHQLKDKISSFLESKDPALANKYQEATDYYRQNLSPYLDNRRIKELATAKRINPANIHNIFKNPEPGMEKIAADLGDEGKNQILYSALGHNAATATPGKITSALLNLDKRGLESYVTPAVAKSFKSLGSRMRNKDLALSLFSTFAGSQAGKTIGGGGGELAGALLGATKGSDFLNGFQNKLPITNLTQSLMDYLSKGYSTGSKSVIANLLS